MSNLFKVYFLKKSKTFANLHAIACQFKVAQIKKFIFSFSWRFTICFVDTKLIEVSLFRHWLIYKLRWMRIWLKVYSNENRIYFQCFYLTECSFSTIQIQPLQLVNFPSVGNNNFWELFQCVCRRLGNRRIAWYS